MLEIFVLSMCIGRFQCDSAFKAYYKQNVQLQHVIKKTIDDSKEEIGKPAESALALMLPIAIIANGSEAKFRIKKDLYLRGDRDQQKLSWEWTF